MPERQSTTGGQPGATLSTVQDGIERLAREGAQRLLQAALEAEVEDHLRRYSQQRDERGRQQVVRNGHAPERTLLTGVGPVKVARPRVVEREAAGQAGHEPFRSALLPRFLRRTPTLEAALATLYLKGGEQQRLPHRPGGDPGGGRLGAVGATTTCRG